MDENAARYQIYLALNSRPYLDVSSVELLSAIREFGAR